MTDLPLNFERSLYQAVARFKAEHLEELEERTRLRKERERKDQTNEA